MPILSNPVNLAMPAFVLLVRNRDRYCPSDTLTSLAPGLGSTGWSHDGSRETSDMIRERWEASHPCAGAPVVI